MSNISPIIPDNITYNDLKYRLQNIQCCLPNKAVELYNRINLGINCCNEERQLNVAMAYLDMLKCYITNWEAPYSYYVDVTVGPTTNFSITLEIPDLDANSQVFSNFKFTLVGYNAVYATPVSINTIIADYVAFTGNQMSLFNIEHFTKSTRFDISIQVDCLFANQSGNVEFMYYILHIETPTNSSVDFNNCVTTQYYIEGPAYTSQDSANCLSREEVVNMFEWLQKYCCMCFPNYGNYDNITPILEE